MKTQTSRQIMKLTAYHSSTNCQHDISTVFQEPQRALLRPLLMSGSTHHCASRHMANLVLPLICDAKETSVHQSAPSAVNVFCRDYNAAWTFRCKPSSDHAAPTVAVCSVRELSWQRKRCLSWHFELPVRPSRQAKNFGVYPTR